MQPAHSADQNFANQNSIDRILNSLIDYRRYWVVPMILGFAASAVYACFLYQKQYTARQSLIVRDDLMGDAFKPSRFESLDSMKSAQETILEIARKPQVVKKVLEQIGPERQPLFSFGSSYPSSEAIEDAQGQITFSAPNGAEFGRTEAVVLKVTSSSPERAAEFVKLLVEQVAVKLSEVKTLRLQSMQSELSSASRAAYVSLEKASADLQKIERSFGADITTIRGLTDPQSGGTFDTKLNQIRQEKRESVNQLTSAQQQKELLETAVLSGDLEFATSSELMSLQPALAALMENLSKAKAQLAIDEGRYLGRHPALRNSREAVKQQKQQLFDSLGLAISGLDSQISLAKSRVQRLDQSIEQLEEDLVNLTSQRVPYVTLQAEVANKTKVFSDLQGKLDEVESYIQSSGNIALMTPIDEPQVSNRADGPGRAMMVMVGTMAGLISGLGLVMLVVPPADDDRYASAVGQSQYQKPSRPTAPGYQANTPSDVERGTGDGAAPDANAPLREETVSESRLRSVADRMQQQKTSQAKSAATGSGTTSSVTSLMSDALDSVIPDSVAKHMASLKKANNKSASSRSGDAAANRSGTDAAGVPAAGKPETAAMITESKSSPGISRLVEGFQSARSKAVAEAGAVETGAGQPDHGSSGSTLQSIRNTLESLDKATDDERKLHEAMMTEVKPDIVVSERKRKPEVPESISKGRITAESLIMSAEGRQSAAGESGEQESSHSRQEEPTAASVPAESNAFAVDPEIVRKVSDSNPGQNALDDKELRMPSITDYASGVGRPVAENLANHGSQELQDPEKSPIQLKRRTSKSDAKVAEHDLIDSVRSVAQNIKPEEAVTLSQGDEPEESSDRSDVGGTGAETGSAVPKNERKVVETSSIPAQIRELSDSISVFARPTVDSNLSSGAGV